MGAPLPTAVVIGCFALYHRGHHELLSQALERSREVVAVLGSAFHPRSPRHPFTWQEREAMIRLCVPEADRERLRFVPVRDYFRDDRWAAAVLAAVQRASEGAADTALVLDARADAQQYREWFPSWRQEPVECHAATVDPARLRGIWLKAGVGEHRAERLEGALAVISQWVPAPVVEYLRSWARLPHFEELAAEQEASEEALAKWQGSPFEPVFTTVDAVVRCAGHVLLVERRNRPGKGLWALPGGYIDPRERLLDSALRELREETGLVLDAALIRPALRRVVVADHPDRSQRGRTITHAHFFELAAGTLPEVKGADDAAEAKWVPVAALAGMEELFFEDHFLLLDELLSLT